MLTPPSAVAEPVPPDDDAAPDHLVVSAWSVISPLGVGARPFAAGLLAGRSGIVPLDGAPGTLPYSHAGLVENFTPSGALGRRGTRSMDRATGLAVATVGDLLGDRPSEGSEQELGLVLGTTNGSVSSMMGFTRDSLTQDRPYLVDPARFPNTVMNCAAGQCAIWHGLRGPNTTVAGGQLTGLLALQYGRRLERCGHVKSVLCGAVEEYSLERAWLDWHTRGADEGGPPPGEGCAVFLLEAATTARRAGRAPVADILALEFAASSPKTSVKAVLAGCLRRALRAAEVSPGSVWALAPSGVTSADEERAAAGAVLGEPAPLIVSCIDAIGDTAASSAAFQLAAVLAVAGSAPEAWGRAAVITSVDRDGGVGCAVVRLLGPRGT